MIYVIIGIGIIGVLILLVLIFKPFNKTNTEQCIHLWGAVEDGWQYCTKCGAARISGCVHDWEVEKRSTITRTTDDGQVGEEYIYKCKKCTIRKYVRTSITNEPIVKIL